MRRFVVEKLKQDLPVKGGVPAAEYAVNVARARCPPEHPIWALITGALLVPLPRSAPLAPEAVWPAAPIAESLHAVGLSRGVAAAIRRVRPVRTSHRTAGVNRPGVIAHRDSIEVERSLALEASARVCLVDDVVTRGSTMLAAAFLLRRLLPGIEVSGLALFRTETTGAEYLDDYFAPKVETVSYQGIWAKRR